VIANNMANLETVGFRRTWLFRPTAAGRSGDAQWAGMSNAMLDKIGGGALASPTRVDTSQGILEPPAIISTPRSPVPDFLLYPAPTASSG